MAIEHSSGKTKAITRSEKPSIVWLGKLMAATKAAFPNQTITTETAQVYLGDWAELATRYGQKNLETVLTEWRQSQRFFPLTADLKSALEAKAMQPKEFQSEKPPCDCSPKSLIDLGGKECPHGTVWGTGFLRNALKGACEPKDAIEVSDRRAELKRQAEELSQ